MAELSGKARIFTCSVSRAVAVQVMREMRVGGWTWALVLATVPVFGTAWAAASMKASMYEQDAGTACGHYHAALSAHDGDTTDLGIGARDRGRRVRPPVEAGGQDARLSETHTKVAQANFQRDRPGRTQRAGPVVRRDCRHRLKLINPDMSGGPDTWIGLPMPSGRGRSARDVRCD